jgi:hypothetical protein
LIIILVLSLQPGDKPGQKKSSQYQQAGIKIPEFFHCQIPGLPVWIDSRFQLPPEIILIIITNAGKAAPIAINCIWFITAGQHKESVELADIRMKGPLILVPPKFRPWKIILYRPAEETYGSHC